MIEIMLQQQAASASTRTQASSAEQLPDQKNERSESRPAVAVDEAAEAAVLADEAAAVAPAASAVAATLAVAVATAEAVAAAAW